MLESLVPARWSALGELWAKLDIKLCLASHALQNVYRTLYSNWYERDEVEHPQKRQILQMWCLLLLSGLCRSVAQAGSLAGKIVIDTTNPYRWAEGGGIVRMIGENVSGAETIQIVLPGARLVKHWKSLHFR